MSSAAALAEVSTSPAAGIPIASSEASCASTRAASCWSRTAHGGQRRATRRSLRPNLGSADAPARPRHRGHTARRTGHPATATAVPSATRSITWPCWHAGWQPVPVPRFEPFAALRYSPVRASRRRRPRRPTTCCRTADVEALLHRHRHNIVAVDVPLERDGPQRYERAGRSDRSMDRPTGSWFAMLRPR